MPKEYALRLGRFLFLAPLSEAYKQAFGGLEFDHFGSHAHSQSSSFKSQKGVTPPSQYVQAPIPGGICSIASNQLRICFVLGLANNHSLAIGNVFE